MANETTTTTLTEAIPTIVTNALLELDEVDIVRPLIKNVMFTGPGVVHETPFIQRLTAETDDNLANAALDSGSSDETSPASATVGAHGGTVLIKELAKLGAVDDVPAIAGQLLGQAMGVQQDTDLVGLFSSLTPNLGDANEDIVVADFYSAYKNLREGIAPLPYNMVVTPGQFWGTVGIATLFETTSGKIQSQALGSVQEEFARSGFVGKVLGFDMYIDSNITVSSNNASGAAFSRDAMEYVEKRGMQVEVDRDLVGEVGDRVTITGYWGESILRNKHGVEMQFNEDT